MVSRHVYANIMPPDEVEGRFNTTLEPCPFCRTRNVGLFCGPLPHVSCMQCGADGPIDERRGLDVAEKQFQAIRLWNIRPGAVTK